MTTELGWGTVPLEGSRVLVTGAVGGLGSRLMSALTEVGANVVGIDRPGTKSANDLRLINADLINEQDARAAVTEGVDLLGGLDGLVNAAGVVDTIHRAERFPLSTFRDDLEANLNVQFIVAQAAFPALRSAHGSSIVFVSSVAAQDGLPGQASYATAKAGVLGLSRSLAAEWAGVGIRVNALVPGLFNTPKVLALPASTRKRMLSSVPMGRLATVEEVVGSVLYLLSPAAGYMTGQALRIDGGAGLALDGLYR